MKRNQTLSHIKDEKTPSSSGTPYKSNTKHWRYRQRNQDSFVENSYRSAGSKLAKKFCSNKSYSKPSSSQEHEAKEELEIPGFYYDQEKKRYFKIQPSYSNISSTVTREIIQKKEKEKKRQKDLSDVGISKLLFCHRTDCRKSAVNTCHLPGLLNRLHTGMSTTEMIDKIFLQRRIANISNKPKHVNFLSTYQTAGNVYIENMQQLLISENDDMVVGLWTEKESLRKTLKILSLKEFSKTSESNPSRLHADLLCENFLFVKVTNMCWAGQGHGSDRCILHTSMTYTGELNSVAMIRSLNNFADISQSFSLGNKCVWTCAWNAKGGNFSVGTEKNALLIDVATRKMWELSTHNGDPLSQVFASENCHQLYSGTRRSHIVCHDLRSISTRPVFSVSQSSSVCSLRTLHDESKLLASDVNGKVCLWDTRTRRIVVNYKGITNRYKQIPIHVDKSERTVYGVDQDGYTRFWCLQTGELLKCLPPPSSLAHEHTPAVAYSEQWAGQKGIAGLLMGLGNEMHFYSSFHEPYQ